MSLVSFCETMSTIKVPIGTITAPFGSIDSVHKIPHTGCDLYCPVGTELYAPLDGIVFRIVDYGNHGLGRAVFIKLHDGKQYVLGHLSEVKVKIGDVVHKGDLIALSGNSGHSTGPHLHFSIIDEYGHFLDPNKYFENIHSSIALLTDNAVEVLTNVPDLICEASNSLFDFINIITQLI
jgi:murein DD-endopeptidase MepM/ murein hydrolase activator NlpD